MCKRIFSFLRSKKKIQSKIVLALLLFFVNISLFPQSFIVGYYPDWLKTTLPASEVQFENLTHIIQAFAWPKSDGEISMYNSLLYPELVDATHNAGRKILIAIGGWGHCDGFSAMAADSVFRKNFINNVIGLIQTENLDGIDIDWESPQNSTDKNNLTLLVKEMRRRFNEVNPSLLISMAVSVGNYSGQYFDYQAMISDVDWFSMMAYDFHGGWTDHAGHNAPLFQPPEETDGSVYNGFQYLHITRGIPKDKILLGMPFYGKHFYASELYGPATDGNTIYLYSEIVKKIQTGGWIYHWDDFSQVPYLIHVDNNRFVTYDDTTSIRRKCEFAKDNSLGGIMIWALGQDVVNGSQPLLETIGKTMQVHNSIIKKKRFVQDFYLLDNYPNPFNPCTTIPFYLEKSIPVKLSIFNVSGQLIQVIEKSIVHRGMNTIHWDASGLSTGVYFYQLQVEGSCQMEKMLFVK